MSDRDFNDAAMRRKTEKVKRERAEEVRRKREKEQAEWNRRKAHASSVWQSPSVCKRFFERAERHAHFLAQVQAGNYSISSTPKATARQSWDAAIEKALPECAGNKSRAVALVAKRRPELRQLLVDEANRR